ncbi:type II toxin-antitoxin system VapC family toxin [Ferrigenium sp. UT5]|uniref:type II toxin-antitoxin system VapC family toxin n=1 Tax=Ferrigenium sp. UT5 TaxID=3242105 RepID=UPI00354CA50A
MIALDTNILARFLLKDDAAQFRLARELLARPEIYTVPPTVMLELVWVLESYECTRQEVLQSLRMLLGLPNFKPKSFEALCHAVKWYEAGMDFGDALHLALSDGDDVFVSFDKSFGKIAAQHDTVPAVQVLRRSTK